MAEYPLYKPIYILPRGRESRILELGFVHKKYFSSMRPSSFLILLRFSALAVLGVLGVFIFGVDPASLTLAGQGIFFLLLGVFVCVSVTLGLLALARRFLPTSAVEAYLPAATRQGALIGFSVAAIAFMQFSGYLTGWAALLVFALVLLIEFTVRQFN